MHQRLFGEAALYGGRIRANEDGLFVDIFHAFYFRRCFNLCS